MARRGLMTLLQLLVVASAVLIATPVSVAAGEGDQRGRECGPGSIEGELPMPPEGLVVRQTFTLDRNCNIVAGPIETLPESELEAATATDGSTFGSVSETRRAPRPSDVSTAGSGSGCCWAGYVVQRSWDCCGLLMNEYWTEFTFNKCSGGFCSPYLRTYWAQDGGKWRGEVGSCGPGWMRNSSDHYLYRSAGGVGYTSVTISGHQGYSYRGRFDCGGNDYYNSYWQSLTGSSSGNWSCSYSHSWRKSFFGWSLQAWCGSGAFPYK